LHILSVYIYIYIYILYVYLSYILLQKENKEITRPNWRCRVGTPGPITPEAPTSGLKTLCISPCCRSRVLSGYIPLPSFSPFPHRPPLLPSSREGKRCRRERGRERTRAGTDRYTATGSVHIHTRARARTHTHIHTQARRFTHTRTRVRKKLRVRLTAGHRDVGSSWSSVVAGRVGKKKSI